MENLSRLAKVWKLTTSPNPGEAAAARERARVIVGREGKTLADVPNLLRGQATAAAGPKPAPSGFTFYNMSNPEHRSAYAEHDRKRRADRARQEAPERAEVVARYGSAGSSIQSTSPRGLRVVGGAILSEGFEGRLTGSLAAERGISAVVVHLANCDY